VGVVDPIVDYASLCCIIVRHLDNQPYASRGAIDHVVMVVPKKYLHGFLSGDCQTVNVWLVSNTLPANTIHAERAAAIDGDAPALKHP
jgi:hypothetical protein